MPSSEKIPVLYTTFNRLEYTKQTLPALIRNTPDGEIIVVDNGSTDGTTDYLLQYKDQVQLLLFKNNYGVARAMNEFFDLTQSAEYVAKVDNDTLVPAGWLGDLRSVFDVAGLDIVQAAHYFRSRIYANWDELIANTESSALPGGNLVYVDCVGGSGIVFKRNIITRCLDNTAGLLNGWWCFMFAKKQELTWAFYDGVWIDLLDMAGFNKYADDIDKQYFSETGREYDEPC